APVRGGGGMAREGAPRRVPRGRRRRARAIHRRRDRQRDPALRRSAKAAQPARHRRHAAAPPRDELMTFLWPELLWLLAAAPLLVLAYVWLLRRRKKAALRYASLTMVK